MYSFYLLLSICLTVICSSKCFLWNSKSESAFEDGADPHDYGVDVSYPIHGYITKNTIFKRRYEQSMKGCYEKFSRAECDGNERARINMNLDQPRSQHNYTEIGFKKTRVPDDIWQEIISFYEANKDKQKLENWPRGNTYTNNWDSPTYMVSFEDRQLRGGVALKQRIWNGIKPIIEEWTGKQLVESSLYGIRVYKRGAVLATRKHVIW
jgi:hypothetical protein